MKLKIYRYNIVNSTNDIAVKKINYKRTSGIVIANKQIKGRGRFGRKWISYEGNFHASVFFKISNNTNINKFTKYNSEIIKNLISKIINKRSLIIKKPNDILVNKAKICGILQETVIKDKKKFIIIGVGINIVESPNLRGYKTTYINKFLKYKISKLVVLYKIKKLYEKKIRKLEICI